MDPITLGLLIATGNALGGLAEGFGDRVAGRIVKTRADDALAERNKTFRERLAGERERHAERMAFEREKLEREFQQRDDQLVLAEELRRWPLPSLPSQIRGFSANHGDALNLYIIASDEVADGRTGTSGLARVLPRTIEPWLSDYYGENAGAHRVLPYIRYLADRSSSPDWQSLVSTLWSQLRSEPSLLIDVSADDQELRFKVACWGGSFDDGPAQSTLFRSSQLTVALGETANDERDALLSMGVKTAAASLIDLHVFTEAIEAPPLPSGVLSLADVIADNAVPFEAIDHRLREALVPVFKSAPSLATQSGLELARRYQEAGREAEGRRVFGWVRDQLALLDGAPREAAKDWEDVSALANAQAQLDTATRRALEDVRETLGAQRAPEWPADATALRPSLSALMRDAHARGSARQGED